MTATTQRWLIVLAVLVYAIAFQGTRGLYSPDEGRYTNVALNMLDSGDWLKPMLHREVEHWAKPPLTYWSVAASVAVFGRSELAARLPGALAFAGRVLPDATLRGMRIFRSHGGTVPAVAGWNLSSEVSSPGSDAPCRGRLAGRGADTPAICLRVGTVTARTAPACGRSFASRYGSDLLPLRLHSLLQWGDAVFHAAPLEEVDGLCQVRSLPAVTPPLRAPLVGAGPCGGVGPPGNATAFWSAQ